MRRPAAIVALFVSIVATTPTEARVLKVGEAVRSAGEHNLGLKAQEEGLAQLAAAVDIAFAGLLPKVLVTGTWLHMGERNTPDIDFTSSLVNSPLGPMMAEWCATHLEQCQASGAGGGGGSLDSFVPPANTFTGALRLQVPVLEPTAFPAWWGAQDQVEALRHGLQHGRLQLLYGVVKGYYGLLTVQNLLGVAGRSIESADEHHRSAKVRTSLQSGTLMEVKRAELEVTRAQSERAKMLAQQEKAKASFRYLTGLSGAFEVEDPGLSTEAAARTPEEWRSLADAQRADLAAARSRLDAAQHDVQKARWSYLPTVGLMGEATADNKEEQRFDDDPFSWIVMGTLTLVAWDGGIRDAAQRAADSRVRQARLQLDDLERRLDSETAAAYQALRDAVTSRELAERQLEVAGATQALAKASEAAGAATNLEVIDANTMVFASEAGLEGARLAEAMAILDLLAASGSPLPFGE